MSLGESCRDRPPLQGLWSDGGVPAGPRRWARAESLSELLERLKIGWQVPHGDVERAVTTIREMMKTPEAERLAMGQRAREAFRGDLGRATLLKRFCDVLERGLPSPK